MNITKRGLWIKEKIGKKVLSVKIKSARIYFFADSFYCNLQSLLTSVDIGVLK